MRPTFLVLLLAVALSGCADTSAPMAPPDEFRSGDQFEATETTGIIRGVVVDESITPIAGVTLTLTASGTSALSNEVGEFGFDGLEPGTYFLEAAKPGFLPTQASAAVVAGDDRPPVLKVVLARDTEFNPFSTTTHHQGYYQCGLSFVVVCGAPNVLLGDGTGDDSSTWTFLYPKQPDHVQTEMVWETTQQVSPDLRLEVETLDGCSGPTLIGNILGPSPLRIVANETRLIAHGVGGDCGLYHSVFAGDVLEQQHCFVWGPVPLVKCGVGFALEQDFEWFVSEFHGYAPPEDWWFIEHGDHPPPL